MLRIAVEPADLAASRFGIAPLTELEFLIRRLSRPRSRATVVGSDLPARWANRFTEAADGLDLRIIQALQPPAWGPAFLTPPPTGLARTVADDLAAVRSTPPALARRQVAQARSAVGPAAPEVERFLAGPHVAMRLADVLERLWTSLIAPDWPLLLAILERDILHRAEALTRRGWGAAIEGLHPQLRWMENCLRVSNRRDQVVRLDGRGLVFVPSVFIHPRLATELGPAWQPTLIYPARGSGALWERSAATPAALARLLGSTRASLLTHLSTPASTTQLSRITGVALGAVGDHLRILLDAGFVSSARAGRSMIYRRTPIAEAVIVGVPVSNE